jgi:hypothetical protein
MKIVFDPMVNFFDQPFFFPDQMFERIDDTTKYRAFDSSISKYRQHH